MITDCFSSYSSHEFRLAQFLIGYIHGFTKGRKKLAEHKRPAQPCNADRVQTVKTASGGLRTRLSAVVAREIPRLSSAGAPAPTSPDRPSVTWSCSHTRRGSRPFRELPFSSPASNMACALWRPGLGGDLALPRPRSNQAPHLLDRAADIHAPSLQAGAILHMSSHTIIPLVPA
jgi:hypothetical protein